MKEIVLKPFLVDKNHWTKTEIKETANAKAIENRDKEWWTPPDNAEILDNTESLDISDSLYCGSGIIRSKSSSFVHVVS